MKTILILYPKYFKCFSKFSRKVSRIIQNIDEYSIAYPEDPNGFIETFFCEKMPTIALHENENWTVGDITHAIIFDDGEEYPSETQNIKNANITLRLINIPITRVINIKKETQFKNKKCTTDYEYIGRGSYWGNPYSMYDSGDSRDEVISKFKYDFDHDNFPNKEKNKVFSLAGKRLGCYCKPEKCHGDILADYLNSWDNEE